METEEQLLADIKKYMNAIEARKAKFTQVHRQCIWIGETTRYGIYEDVAAIDFAFYLLVRSNKGSMGDLFRDMLFFFWTHPKFIEEVI